jgi:hypothetical protein
VSVAKQTKPSNQGTGFGIFFAICGLVTLGVGAYFAFRYTRISRELLLTNGAGRPSKADTLQIIRLGLIVNLVGMLLTILGAQAIVGSILQSLYLSHKAALRQLTPADLCSQWIYLLCRQTPTPLLPILSESPLPFGCSIE